MTLTVWVSRLTSKVLTPKDQRVRIKSDETGRASLTFQLLEDTLHGARASAASHSHIELVLVVGHGGILFCGRGVVGRRGRRCLAITVDFRVVVSDKYKKEK